MHEYTLIGIVVAGMVAGGLFFYLRSRKGK